MVEILHKLRIYEVLMLTCVLTAKSFAENSSNDSPGVLYFGFFFDETTASSIKLISDTYFNTSLSELPEFASFLENVSSSANITNVQEFYVKPLDPNSKEYDPLYHVTAKYCGRNQKACAEYEKKYSKFIDTKFEMHLVGYVLTSRTFGIRVDLTSQQEELFDRNSKRVRRIDSSDDHVSSLVRSSLPGVQVELQQTFPPILPVVTTKAHITLGCAPRVAAVITGSDANETLWYESNSSFGWKESWDNITDPYDPQGSTMRVTLFKPMANSSSSDYLFVLYPRVKLIANATLNRYLQRSSSSASSSITRNRFVGAEFNGSDNSRLLSIIYAMFFQLNIFCMGQYLFGQF